MNITTLFFFLIASVILTGCTSNKNIIINPEINAYHFAHTNETIVVTGANEWTNITFTEEITDIGLSIEHLHNSSENDSFKILVPGVYNIHFDFDLLDNSPSASEIHAAARLILENGSEIAGSVYEADITKQGSEVDLSHNFLAEFLANDIVTFQFIADDEDVQLSSHGTFGESPESANIIIQRIARIE